MEEEKDHGEMTTTIIGIELDRSLGVKRLIKSLAQLKSQKTI